MPYKSPSFMRSFEIVHECSPEMVSDDIRGKEYNFPEDDQKQYMESIAFNSPFRKMFYCIYDEIINDVKHINKGQDLNEYRNDEICIFILNKYCSFIVLWTNIMGIHVDSSGEHVSNAPVEFAYFLQKHIILPQKSVRADVFVKVMRIDYLSSLKELRYNYKMFGPISEEIEDILASSFDNLNGKEKNVTVKKEHSYVSSTPIDNKNTSLEIVESDHSYIKTVSYTEPVEEWKKKDFKKRANIRPKIMLASKASKKISLNKRKENRISRQDKLYLFKLDYLFQEINNIMDSVGFGFYDILETSDWNSLNDGNWLTNFVLDACLLAIIKDSRSIDCFSMPCQFNEINFDKMNMLIQNQPEMIFVPILSSKHYTLCILNFSTHEFMYVNSYKTLSVGQNVYDLFMAKLSSDKKVWKYKEISDRAMQEDGSNCGIFVLMYAMKILQNESLIYLWKPSDFRKKMKLLLLSHQGDRSRFCCHCCALRKSNCDAIVCKDCKYYICSNCSHKHSQIDSKVCKIIEQNILSI